MTTPVDETVTSGEPDVRTKSTVPTAPLTAIRALKVLRAVGTTSIVVGDDG